MADGETSVGVLRSWVAAFVQARAWEPFHTPKDLASAIAVEAAELMELFLWKDAGEVDAVVHQRETRQEVDDELADIVILCLSLANRLEIDVSEAVAKKIAANDTKYPVEKVRGKADKYTAY